MSLTSKRIELYSAITSGNIDHVIEMKDHGQFHVSEIMKEKYGYSTKHITLAKPFPNIIKLLIQWELERDKYFADCMLEFAVFDKNSELAYISIKSGASVNGTESYRNRIIDIVNYNLLDLCKIYIDEGVDTSIIDECGRGIFHYVKSHEMLDLILPYMIADHEDEWGRTAYRTHMEGIPNGNGNSPIDRNLRTELANRIFKKLNKSFL